MLIFGLLGCVVEHGEAVVLVVVVAGGPGEAGAERRVGGGEQHVTKEATVAGGNEEIRDELDAKTVES